MGISSHRRSAIDHNAHERAIIANADRWQAYLFIGRAQKHVIPCTTEAEGRAAAQALANEHQRPALVYAIAGQASAMLASISPARLVAESCEPGAVPAS